MRPSRISCVTSLNERTKKLGVGEMKVMTIIRGGGNESDHESWRCHHERVMDVSRFITIS